MSGSVKQRSNFKFTEKLSLLYDARMHMYFFKFTKLSKMSKFYETNRIFCKEIANIAYIFWS